MKLTPVVLTLTLVSCLLVNHVIADDCIAKLGEPIEFESGCQSFKFLDFEIEFKDAGRPDPKTAMYCWNYVIRSTNESQKLSLCNSGSLGGDSRFTLDGIKYVVDRDVPAKCIGNRWVLGLRIWRDSPSLPPYSQRLKSLPNVDSLNCNQQEVNK